MGNYEIREFYGEEVIQYKKLNTIMYRSKDELLSDEEACIKNITEVDSKRGLGFFRMGAFYEGKLYAALQSTEFDTTFDGTTCKMSGIGGVVSDFNSPFKGAMKEIYKKSFETMREKGQYLSHLYPFEENYYRQYGYDISVRSASWSVPIEKLGIYNDGVVMPYDGTDKMKEDIKNVFRKFAEDKNLMVLKNDDDWDNFFEKRKPYVSGVNAFVRYTADGVADAYMSYSPRSAGDLPQDMVVGTLWFADYCALRSILAYFKTQRPYCNYLKLTLPDGIDISPMVDSGGGWGKREATSLLGNEGTTRVVDAEEILKIAKYKGEGKVCIKICDDTYAPWNNDCYEVEFGSDGTKVTRGATNPDIEMSINSFSTAILGRLDAANLCLFPDVKVHNSDNLDKVFYKKLLWIENHF